MIARSVELEGLSSITKDDIIAEARHYESLGYNVRVYYRKGWWLMFTKLEPIPDQSQSVSYIDHDLD